MKARLFRLGTQDVGSRRCSIRNVNRSTLDQRWTVASVVFAAAVAVASVMELPSRSTAVGGVYYGVPHGDLLLHTAVYLLLTSTACRASAPDPTEEGRRRLRYAAALVACFGGGMELLQLSVPYRSFSLLDVAANVAGVSLGYVFAVRSIYPWKRFR